MQDNNKPSRILALIALVFAVSLPFILVKIFHHKNVKITSKQQLSLPRPPAQTPPAPDQEPQDNDWQIIQTQEGDSLAGIFNRLGLSAQTLQQVLSGSQHENVLKNIKPKQTLQILIVDKTLEKLIVPFTANQYLMIYREADQYRSKINSRKMNSHNHYLTATIQGSLYSTAKRLGIPYKLIRQMTEIFAWEIDFSKDIRAGDRFTIIYKAFYIEDKLVGTGDIVAITLTNRGRQFQAIRHTNTKGETHYYTEKGNSLVKAFNRYPVRFSHISSTFSLNRYHPILKKKRPHKGIDLAAPLGTPITATGDGQIVVLERHSGYGNVIKIKHNGTFSSIYAHMLRFQKGLNKGSFVKRGQVIGYVGQTGLATGPHCHYEFHVNKAPKNPTTIELPRSPSVPSSEMAAFEAKTATLLAQLKLFEDAKKEQSTSGVSDIG